MTRFLTYHHFQSGTVLRVSMALATATILAGALTAPQARPLLLPIAVLMVLIGFVMHGLDVSVNGESVLVKFGPGLLRKAIPLADISEARPVRNHWLMGWGIRYFGHGWMWNVSGLDAVELRLKDGRCFRIGTDDPQGLSEAIRAKQA